MHLIKMHNCDVCEEGNFEIMPISRCFKKSEFAVYSGEEPTLTFFLVLPFHVYYNLVDLLYKLECSVWLQRIK